MSIYYIDLVNGSDAADGTSWANTWKTFTSGATEARIAPGDEIRIAKTPDPVASGVNGTFTNASKTVTLSAAVTATIDNCESNWTGVNGASASRQNTPHKEGSYFNYVVLPASPSTSTLYAYYTISDTDFSSYTKISFWFYNSATIQATHWKFCLCSDTDGTMIVDTFELPSIESIQRWIPITIIKTGGGNLGSSIQSIAIYSNTVSPTGSSNIRIDNIIACNGLSLQSLISKSSSATWQSEAWYPIQSIDGTTILIDNDPQTIATSGQGYSGTSETVALYYRETFKTALATSSTTQVSVINDSGTLGSPITFSGGWNTATTEQDGMTFMDGLNGYGYGLYASSKNYITIDFIGMCRYLRGMFFSVVSNFNIYNSNFIGSNNYNIFFATGYYNSLINAILNNGASYGFYSTAFYNILNNVRVLSNGSLGLSFAQYSEANSLISSNNVLSDISNDGAFIYINNSILSSSSEVQVSSNGVIKSLWHDQTEGNNWVFETDATANWQTTTYYSTETGSWKSAITGSTRTTANPFKLKIAEIACTASTQVTVTTHVKKDHATNVGCKLVTYANTILGITETSDTKADDTDWEELSVSFTPTNQGVVEIYLESWYSAGTSNTYVGAITVTT